MYTIFFFVSYFMLQLKVKYVYNSQKEKKNVRFATIINSIELKMSPVFILFISLFTANMCVCINIHFRWNFSLTLSQAQETKNLCTTWKKNKKNILFTISWSHLTLGILWNIGQVVNGLCKYCLILFRVKLFS